MPQIVFLFIFLRISHFPFCKYFSEKMFLRSVGQENIPFLLLKRTLIMICACRLKYLIAFQKLSFTCCFNIYLLEIYWILKRNSDSIMCLKIVIIRQLKRYNFVKKKVNKTKNIKNIIDDLMLNVL